MDKRIIDLSDIKNNDLEETSTFTDLLSKKEKKKRKKEILLEKENSNIEVSNEENIDIEDMIDEKKRTTSDLKKELAEAQEIYQNNYKEEIKEEEKKQVESEEKLGKTQILEITRAMKFNFEEAKKNNTKGKRLISPLNIIGEINLLCIGYYIYLLIFTSYQEEQQNYLITGFIIVLLVLLFGLSVVTNKKISKIFNILNILAIFGFIIFNAYTLIN